MSFSAARSFLGVRAGLGASALVLLSLLTGCAAEVDEDPGAQYPRSPAPGMDIPPTADATGVLYGQPDPGAQAGVGETTIGAPDPAGPAADEYADTDPSALTDFHGALDPYGQWVEDPNYGTIWQPSPEAVGPDFAPYETNGYWTYGDNYVWVSGYPWGWAPFHYGRWVYATNGWGWIPGRQYAGAWTTWRTGYGPYAGYVGWAPLPPTWYWNGGVAVGIGVVPYASYGFCSAGNLFASSLSGRMLAGPQVAALGQYTQPVLHSGQGATGRGGVYGSGPSGGRTLANPSVAGPSPASLNIAGSSVRPTPDQQPGAGAGQAVRAPFDRNGARGARSCHHAHGRTRQRLARLDHGTAASVPYDSRLRAALPPTEATTEASTASRTRSEGARPPTGAAARALRSTDCRRSARTRCTREGACTPAWPPHRTTSRPTTARATTRAAAEGEGTSEGTSEAAGAVDAVEGGIVDEWRFAPKTLTPPAPPSPSKRGRGGRRRAPPRPWRERGRGVRASWLD